MQYKIIEAYNAEDMEAFVNEYIENWFHVLWGCQAVSHNSFWNRLLYIQTVIKTNDHYSHTFEMKASDYKVTIDPVRMQ